MFQFLHGYLPGVWEAQVKAGLVGENDGIRFCQSIMLKDEMKFNKLARKDGEFTLFVDVCAQALADSNVELKKAAALNYLAEVNLITRRSYKELDIAMTKARQIRNQKG